MTNGITDELLKQISHLGEVECQSGNDISDSHRQRRNLQSRDQHLDGYRSSDDGALRTHRLLACRRHRAHRRRRQRRRRPEQSRNLQSDQRHVRFRHGRAQLAP